MSIKQSRSVWLSRILIVVGFASLIIGIMAIGAFSAAYIFYGWCVWKSSCVSTPDGHQLLIDLIEAGAVGVFGVIAGILLLIFGFRRKRSLSQLHEPMI